MLKIALPNGSLEQETMQLFEDANLKVLRELRQHDAKIIHPDISQVTIMRPQHIPNLVADGTYDIGICGGDCVWESGKWEKVSIESVFPYKPTKVVLVAAKDSRILKLAQITKTMTILSEYPNITKRFLEEKGIQADVQFSYGGTEAHIPRHYPLGVCLVGTGASLTANRLKVIATLCESETVLIASPMMRAHHLLEFQMKALALHSLKLLLNGVIEGRNKILLTMNVAAEKKEGLLMKMLALKSPTVSELAGGKYFAISGVVPRKDTNTLIPELLRSGAEDLIEIPISKVIRSW